MQESVFPFGQEMESMPADATESRLNGAFNGYAARARFRLLNGQVWEQQSFRYMYRYAFMPRVTIFYRGDAYWMKIEGIPETIPVRRVC